MKYRIENISLKASFMKKTLISLLFASVIFAELPTQDFQNSNKFPEDENSQENCVKCLLTGGTAYSETSINGLNCFKGKVSDGIENLIKDWKSCPSYSTDKSILFPKVIEITEDSQQSQTFNATVFSYESFDFTVINQITLDPTISTVNKIKIVKNKSEIEVFYYGSVSTNQESQSDWFTLDSISNNIMPKQTLTQNSITFKVVGPLYGAFSAQVQITITKDPQDNQIQTEDMSSIQLISSFSSLELNSAGVKLLEENQEVASYPSIMTELNKYPITSKCKSIEISNNYFQTLTYTLQAQESCRIEISNSSFNHQNENEPKFEITIESNRQGIIYVVPEVPVGLQDLDQTLEIYEVGPESQAIIEHKYKYSIQLLATDQEQTFTISIQMLITLEQASDLQESEFSENGLSNPDYQQLINAFKFEEGLSSNKLLTSKPAKFYVTETESAFLESELLRGQNLMPLLFSAVEAYRNKRENGIMQDSPSRNFPGDGTFQQVRVQLGFEDQEIYNSQLQSFKEGQYEMRDNEIIYSYEIIYREGPLDKQWMEEKDANYLSRIQKQNLLKQACSEINFMSDRLKNQIEIKTQNFLKTQVNQLLGLFQSSNKLDQAKVLQQQNHKENEQEFINNMLSLLRSEHNDSEGIKWGYSDNNRMETGDWILKSTNKQKDIDDLINSVRKEVLKTRSSIDIMTLDNIEPTCRLWAEVFGPFLQAKGEFEFVKNLTNPIRVRIYFGAEPKIFYGLNPGRYYIRTMFKHLKHLHPNFELIIASGINPPFGWNHAKLIIFDGKVVMTGGMNIRDRFYSISEETIYDLFAKAEGQAATYAQNFVNYHWTLATENHKISYFQGAGIHWAKSYRVSDKVPHLKHRTLELYVGYNKESMKSSLFNNLTYVLEDTNQKERIPIFTVGKRFVEGEPSDTALMQLMRSAKKTMLISQQTLIRNERFWLEPAKNELAKALERGVEVFILLSAEYDKKGLGLQSYLGCSAKAVMKGLANIGVTDEMMKNLHILNMGSYVPVTVKEQQSAPPYQRMNHSKVIIVDGIAAYIGSHNIYYTYGASLSEYGFIIVSKEKVEELIEDYWNPIWFGCFDPRNEDLLLQ